MEDIFHNIIRVIWRRKATHKALTLSSWQTVNRYRVVLGGVFVFVSHSLGLISLLFNNKNPKPPVARLPLKLCAPLYYSYLFLRPFRVPLKRHFLLPSASDGGWWTLWHLSLTFSCLTVFCTQSSSQGQAIPRAFCASKENVESKGLCGTKVNEISTLCLPKESYS